VNHQFFQKNTSDEALMQQIAKKNAEAFELLYERYGTRMFRYFYRMLWQNEALANDFTQDLFLKIIEKPHLFHAEKKFQTWFYAVASNMCKNEYRKSRVVESIDNHVFTYDENYDLSLDLTDYEHFLQKAINDLSAEHRECFVLRHFEDYSVKEIAEITQTAEGTVKSRLHYALKQVAAQVKFLNILEN
jgi:RNA polymerase sigma-70 factor, ECF subfamily